MARGRAEADWAFHAGDDELLAALAEGRHAGSLREYFGAPALAELSQLAAAAQRAKARRGARVLILPGIMGSRLGARGVLWVDPLQIAAGRLTALKLPAAGAALRPVGVLMFSYARLKLELELAGREVCFHPYDWRCGLDVLGAQLAARILEEGRPVVLVGHSMGGLVARMAMRTLPRRWVRKLILVGTPNRGSFAAVQALRGTYPFVRKMALLDRLHSPEYLTEHVFRTFPGLYHLLPAKRGRGIDLFDPRRWPADRPPPDRDLLAGAARIRRGLAPADARMVQILGVNQETVVGARRTAAGFEYTVARRGDGTVPLALARLPGIASYFAEELHGNLANNRDVVRAIVDLVRRGRTRRLPRQPPRIPAATRRIDDAGLRRDGGRKIDWAALSSAEREAALGEFDSARLVCRVPPAG